MTTRLDRLKELAEKATAGPWGTEKTWDEDATGSIHDYTDRVTSESGIVFRWDDDYGTPFPANANFIVSLRNAWPDILRVLEAAREAAAGSTHHLELLPRHELCSWCNLFRALAVFEQEA